MKKDIFSQAIGSSRSNVLRNLCMAIMSQKGCLNLVDLFDHFVPFFLWADKTRNDTKKQKLCINENPFFATLSRRQSTYSPLLGIAAVSGNGKKRF